MCVCVFVCVCMCIHVCVCVSGWVYSTALYLSPIFSTIPQEWSECSQTAFTGFVINNNYAELCLDDEPVFINSQVCYWFMYCGGFIPIYRYVGFLFNHDIAIFCLTCCCCLLPHLLLLCTVFSVVAQNNIPYKCGNGIREPGETCDCGPVEVG